jgi:hypothetical protein
MNLKDTRTKLIAIAAVTAVISFIVASALFNSKAAHNLKSPTVDSIPSSLPDLKNDPTYNAFLNSKALDATQPVQVGNSQNNQPFSQ